MQTTEYVYNIVEGPAETSSIRVASPGWCVIKETWLGSYLADSLVVFSGGSKAEAEAEMKRLQDAET